MKTEHKAPEMSGIFKELAENFISFKRNLGFKYQSEEKVMSRFCRFSNDYDLTEVCITKKLAEDWIAPRAGETGKSRAHRLTCVRQFGEYLYTLGYEVYFLPEQRGMWTASFVPYIFTHEQIIALFAAADKTGKDGSVSVEGLFPGTYTVTEQSIDRYEPQKTQTVTLIGGKTSTVTFNNTLKRGSLEIVKTSEDNLVEGMKFHLYGTSLSLSLIHI